MKIAKLNKLILVLLVFLLNVEYSYSMWSKITGLVKKQHETKRKAKEEAAKKRHEPELKIEEERSAVIKPPKRVTFKDKEFDEDTLKGLSTLQEEDLTELL